MTEMAVQYGMSTKWESVNEEILSLFPGNILKLRFNNVAYCSIDSTSGGPKHIGKFGVNNEKQLEDKTSMIMHGIALANGSPLFEDAMGIWKDYIHVQIGIDLPGTINILCVGIEVLNMPPLPSEG